MFVDDIYEKLIDFWTNLGDYDFSKKQIFAISEKFQKTNFGDFGNIPKQS